MTLYLRKALLFDIPGVEISSNNPLLRIRVNAENLFNRGGDYLGFAASVVITAPRYYQVLERNVKDKIPDNAYWKLANYMQDSERYFYSDLFTGTKDTLQITCNEMIEWAKSAVSNSQLQEERIDPAFAAPTN